MNDQQIIRIRKALEIDCEKEEARLVGFIRSSIRRLHREGAVIGLSGGLDSSLCAYLLKKALGKDNVLAVLLPERDSSPLHRKHAHLVAETLGLETVERDMTKALEEMGIYEIGSKNMTAEEAAEWAKEEEKKAKRFGRYLYHDVMSAYYGEKVSVKWKLWELAAQKKMDERFAFEFSKTRLRMVYLYFYANQRRYAVIGTTDKSEYSTAIYCNYGDGANDIQILRHLYKTQLKQLAQYMKLPAEIIEKPHSGDLYGNLPHTATLGMSYEELDVLLYAMDHGCSEEYLAELAPSGAVASVKQLRKVAVLAESLPLSLYRMPE